MARPLKRGLDYFGLDVDFFHDDKVRIIIKAQGTKAIAVIICLLARIYRNGFYLKWDERKMPYLVADEICADSGVVTEVLSKAIEIGFFDAGIFEKHGVLTSRGIQKRYFAACGKRTQVEVEEDFLLIKPSDVPKNAIRKSATTMPIFKEKAPKRVFSEKTQVFGEKTPVNSEKMPQSKVKYITTTTTTEGEEGQEKEFSEVARLFEDNIHPIAGEIDKDKLADLVQDFGGKWVLEAIKEAALSNVRNIKYITAILDRWKRQGFKAPKAGKGGAKRGGNGRNTRKAKGEGHSDYQEADRNRVYPWDIPAQPGGDGGEPGPDHPD